MHLARILYWIIPGHPIKLEYSICMDSTSALTCIYTIYTGAMYTDLCSCMRINTLSGDNPRNPILFKALQPGHLTPPVLCTAGLTPPTTFTSQSCWLHASNNVDCLPRLPNGTLGPNPFHSKQLCLNLRFR